MNERVRKLRRVSVDTQPRISIERARIETETYKKYEGTMSVPELRATALYEYMRQRKLYMGEGELIVGEKSEGPQVAPTFPELCCHTLEDMHIMNDRELISFKVDEAALDYQRDTVIPFWKERSMRTRLLGAMTDEWKEAYAAGIFTEFMEQRGPGHTVGSNKIYEKGFLDYQADIDAALAALDYMNDPTASQRAEELRAMRIACDAKWSWAAAMLSWRTKWPGRPLTRRAARNSNR